MSITTKEVDQPDPKFKIPEMKEPGVGDITDMGPNLVQSNKEYSKKKWNEKSFYKGIYTGYYKDSYIPEIKSTEKQAKKPKKINYTEVFNKEFTTGRYGYHKETGYELGTVNNNVNKGFNMSEPIQTTHTSLPYQGSWGWSGYQLGSLKFKTENAL